MPIAFSDVVVVDGEIQWYNRFEYMPTQSKEERNIGKCKSDVLYMFYGWYTHFDTMSEREQRNHRH